MSVRGSRAHVEYHHFHFLYTLQSFTDVIGICDSNYVLFSFTDSIDHLPPLSEEQISESLVEKVVNYMVQNSINGGRLQSRHLEHFIFNMVPPNASLMGKTLVNLSTLVKAGIAKADTLNRMVQIGVKFKIKDLQDFVQKYDDDNCTKILTHCSLNGAQLKTAADAAIHNNKYNLLAYLLKHGAKPDVARVIKIVDPSLKMDPVILSYVLANGVPKKIAPFLIKTLNSMNEGSQFINGSEQNNSEHRNLSDAAALLQSTIESSMIICGRDAVSGMRDVIAELLSGAEVHMEAICLLLQCGANSIDLCQAQFKKSTPLHAATALALKAGVYTLFVVTFYTCMYMKGELVLFLYREHQHYLCCC